MPKHTILIVDDEAIILSSIKRLLQNEPFLVTTANGTQEALKILKKQPISLLITDQRMPGISGLELLKDAKRLYPDIIRMVITGYTDFETIVKAINEGEVYRFIIKPWNNEEFKIVIRQALAQYDLLQDNKILLQMVKRQKEVLSEIKTNFPDVTNLPKLKEGAYVIESTSETLADFMRRYFPEKKNEPN